LGVVFGIFAGVYLASRHSHRLKKLVEDEKRLAVRAVRSATDQLSTRLEQREHELAQFHDVGTSLERVIGSFTQLIETVESRLLAINVRLRRLGIVTGDDADEGSLDEPEAEAAQDQPAPEGISEKQPLIR
jgi:hypothetical protein